MKDHSRIYDAAKAANVKDVEKYLEQMKEDTDFQDSLQAILLGCMVHNCDLKIVECLLKFGADVNYCAIDDITPLRRAIELKNFEMTEFLLKNGANANGKGVWGISLLKHVLSNKGFQMAELLVQYGADVNAFEDSKRTALCSTVLNICDLEVVEWLLKKGADPNIKNSYGKTPLYYASLQAKSEKKIEVIKLLVDYGATVEDCDFAGISIYKKYVEESTKEAYGTAGASTKAAIHCAAAEKENSKSEEASDAKNEPMEVDGGVPGSPQDSGAEEGEIDLSGQEYITTHDIYSFEQ